jgi:hypothetical protein
MSQHLTSFNLPAVAPLKGSQIDDLIVSSGKVRMGIFDGPGSPSGIDGLRRAINEADRFQSEVNQQANALRGLMAPISVADIGKQVMIFVSSWPNASGGDLAGYGAQLAQDVIDCQPSRYAITEGFRKLRRTSKFLPSISEVMAALEDAHKRIRNASLHIAELPHAITEARAKLEVMEARELRFAAMQGAGSVDRFGNA